MMPHTIVDTPYPNGVKEELPNGVKEKALVRVKTVRLAPNQLGDVA